jgi:hypothetical protein
MQYGIRWGLKYDFAIFHPSVVLNSMKQTSSWEPNRLSAGHEISSLLWKPKVHNSLPVLPINPAHNFPVYFCKICFNIFFQITPRPSKRSAPCRSPYSLITRPYYARPWRVKYKGLTSEKIMWCFYSLSLSFLIYPQMSEGKFATGVGMKAWVNRPWCVWTSGRRNNVKTKLNSPVILFVTVRMIRRFDSLRLLDTWRCQKLPTVEAHHSTMQLVTSWRWLSSGMLRRVVW